MFAPPYYHAHTCPARSAPEHGLRCRFGMFALVAFPQVEEGRRFIPFPPQYPAIKHQNCCYMAFSQASFAGSLTLCRPTMARPPTARTHLPLSGQPSRCLRQFADHAAVRRPQVHRVWGNFPVQRACSSSRLDSRPAQALYAPFKAYGGLSRGSASSG